jgi:hypothetical protein
MDEDLKKAGRLISVDRPGYGLSEPKTPERSLHPYMLLDPLLAEDGTKIVSEEL